MYQTNYLSVTQVTKLKDEVYTALLEELEKKFTE